MRVAIDGEFFRLPPSGIGGYLRSLTSELRQLDANLVLDVIEPSWDHRQPTEPATRSPLHDRRVQRASWELYGFARATRAKHPDLLHVPSFAAPLRTGTPFVVTVHDVIPFVLPEYRASAAMRANLAVMRRTVRAAKLVIAPSQSAADEIIRVLGIPSEKLRVTHEAADAAYRPGDPGLARETARRFGIESRYIFNVGGLDVRKNVPLLIEAFARVKALLAEPVKLVIAGAPHSDNPTVFPPLAPVIERFGVRDDVVLTGRVSEADKIALYQGADLYVTPSLHEGFGLTALEAMACGVPAIASNLSSFPEIVGNGGLLVDLDVDALAAAMRSVLTDREISENLRERGIRRASEFSWRRTAQLTYDVYREALAIH